MEMVIFILMKKYIIRANEQYLFASFERPFISALLGPRRVGKTTLLQYFIEKHPKRKWARFNMDVLSQRKRVINEELQIMIEQEALQKIGGKEKIWVFIDEAQKCPELFDQVKIIYDAHKGKNHIKFILTGSAHLNLHQLTTESLAGRVELLHLREFNLKEMTHLLHPEASPAFDSPLEILFSSRDAQQIQKIFSELQPFQHICTQSLYNHLLWGGLPEIFEESSEQYRLKYLGDYLQTYLEKDIRAIDSISDLHLFEQLMRVSAECTGSLRDDKRILEALHCSRNTLSKYRNYLLATLQYMEIYPFIENSIKRLVKSPKGYITNNGLVSYLTGIHSLQILQTTGLIGHRFENWFLNELQAWTDTIAERHEIYFWRTSSDAEVDFIVQLGREIVPFEVTFASQIHSKKINNLKSFMKSTPQCHLGVFCYLGPLSYDEKERILYLPAWMM
jgi:predicted AAA+ superfamily ATPase